MKGERDWRDMRGWGTDREYPDPESVREALTGGGGSGDAEGTRSPSPPGEVARKLFEGGLSSDGDRVDLIVVSSDFEEEAEILRDVAALVERCPTCGRMYDCICPNCSACGEGGRPKKLEVR